MKKFIVPAKKEKNACYYRKQVKYGKILINKKINRELHKIQIEDVIKLCIRNANIGRRDLNKQIS